MNEQLSELEKIRQMESGELLTRYADIYHFTEEMRRRAEYRKAEDAAHTSLPYRNEILKRMEQISHD